MLSPLSRVKWTSWYFSLIFYLFSCPCRHGKTVTTTATTYRATVTWHSHQNGLTEKQNKTENSGRNLHAHTHLLENKTASNKQCWEDWAPTGRRLKLDPTSRSVQKPNSNRWKILMKVWKFWLLEWTQGKGAGWHTPVISAFEVEAWELRIKDYLLLYNKFGASLGYMGPDIPRVPMIFL